MFSGTAFAQTQITSEQPRFKADESNTVDINKQIMRMRSNKRALENYEYYPLNITLQAGTISGYIENACNGDFQSYVNFLYPDSNALVVTSNGNTHVYEHLIGNVFDPKDSNVLLQNNPNAPMFSKFTKYTVDTLGVRFGYHRHLDTTVIDGDTVAVVDTLDFQFFNINQLTYTTYLQSTFESFAYPIKANFKLANLTSTAAAGSYKILLTDAYKLRDSSTGWVTNFYNIPVGVTLNPDGNTQSAFGYSMTFRPMVRAKLNDTVFHQASNNEATFKKNNYLTYFYSSNEAPNERGTQTQQFSFYNNSFFVTKSQKYTALPNNGWTTFIPGNAYFAHQYVFAYYQVSTDNLAVKNTSKEVKVLNAYPNPAKENTDVVVSLNSDKYATATVTLTDMTGKVINTLNVDLVNGINNITIPTSGLSLGMYMVNVVGADFESASKIVIE